MAEIRFFNTLGRRLEPFEPLEPGHARLYTCGPTVYNQVHIGNLRTFLFEDLLRRSLRFLGLRVTQVMNLTDVDDKTIRGAEEKGVPLAEFTAPFVAAFFDDLRTLNFEPAEVYPRATEHIAEMVALVGRLVERGFAYESDGSVWFRIAADADYGKLSGFRLDAARRGERVAADEYDKEDVRDFVLWKGAKPGEPSWESPWGPGRPGWHVECSAMSAKYLGETFDIHCGGVDNIFPHHENEIAQSESANGKPFVRTWLHSEHLVVDGEKMSKSLGNFYTLKDLLAKGCSPRALRYLLLSVHYRQKLNFTFASLDAATSALKRIDEMRFRLKHAKERNSGKEENKGSGREEQEGEGSGREEAGSDRLAAAAADRRAEAREGLRGDSGGEASPADSELDRLLSSTRAVFGSSLADDLNISAALAAVFELVKGVNVAIQREVVGPRERERIEAQLVDFDRVLGVLDMPWGIEGGGGSAAEGGSRDDAEIDRLVAERQEARKRRDFAASDRLRDELARRGIAVEDTPHGPRWKRT